MFSASASKESSNLRPRLRRQFLAPSTGRPCQFIAAGLAIFFIVSGLPRAGAVVVTDDFSDGNDTANPTWHHLDGAVGSPGQSWTVTSGQYRLLDPTTTTVGSQFPGLETVGFVGSYVDPQFTDVRVTTDFVDFVPPGEASSFFGVAARLNGDNAQPNLQSGIQLHGYTYHYEGTAASGTGEMVLSILYADGLKDIGSQQVTLDNAKDYRFILEAVGNVLHGQVLELDGAGQVVAMVAEKMRDLDASQANPSGGSRYEHAFISLQPCAFDQGIPCRKIRVQNRRPDDEVHTLWKQYGARLPGDHAFRKTSEPVFATDPITGTEAGHLIAAGNNNTGSICSRDVGQSRPHLIAAAGHQVVHVAYRCGVDVNQNLIG